MERGPQWMLYRSTNHSVPAQSIEVLCRPPQASGAAVPAPRLTPSLASCDERMPPRCSSRVLPSSQLLQFEGVPHLSIPRSSSHQSSKYRFEQFKQQLSVLHTSVTSDLPRGHRGWPSPPSMPQELQCVQCCECAVFQSQIVKKIPKFSCALCGTKQSVRQVWLFLCHASHPMLHQCAGGKEPKSRLPLSLELASLALRWPQVYALSNKGKEVRLVVQRLNAERGRREEAAACASPPAPDSIPTADLPQTDGGRREDWSAFIAPKVIQPRTAPVC